MRLGSALGAVVRLLNGAGIPYMVVGSVASSLHGEPRTTLDLDIVVEPDRSALDRFLASIPERFYVDEDTARDALRRRAMFNLIDQDTGWKVDLVIRRNREFSREEFSRREPAVIDEVSVFVATAEDTVIAKLEWAKDGQSSRQLDDVRRLLAMQPGLDRAYVERWVRELGLEAQWAEVTR